MGGNLFDSLQNNLHNTVNDVFGYMVRWVPSEAPESTYTAKCLKNQPTGKYKVGEVDYSPKLYQIEYKASDLPGLYEAARSGNYEFVVVYPIDTDYTVTGLRYAVSKSDAIWDGQTYKLMIEFSPL